MTTTNEKGPAAGATAPDRGPSILSEGIQSMETNTASAAGALAPVGKLVADHINAVAEHGRLFQLSDWGLVSEDAARAALGPLNDALIAICASRPSDPPQIELRRAYLNAVLPEAVDSSAELTKSVFHWLLKTDGWPS